jgi:hypothetical protein
MTEHANDLSLERLLAHESLPSVERHVHACDLCWRRWEHLHADEGLTLPERMAAPPVLPEPANTLGALPWGLAASSGLVALVALSLLWLRPAVQTEEVERLRQQVEVLQLELEEGRQSRPVTAGAGGVQAERRRPMPRASTPSVTEGPVPVLVAGEAGEIPPEVLQAAVERELESRTREKLDKVRDAGQEKTLVHIGGVVDRLVLGGLLTEEAAGSVEQLLQREVEETWEIKEAVVGGHLSEEDGIADWRMLVRETDAALLVYVDEETLDEVRSALETK